MLYLKRSVKAQNPALGGCCMLDSEWCRLAEFLLHGVIPYSNILHSNIQHSFTLLPFSFVT